MSDQTPKALKVIVISMGVMLVGGFIWVAAVVASRAGEEIAKPRLSANILEECKKISINAPEDAELIFQNGEWIVTLEGEVRRYSECGELLQITTLTSDS